MFGKGGGGRGLGALEEESIKYLKAHTRLTNSWRANSTINSPLVLRTIQYRPTQQQAEERGKEKGSAGKEKISVGREKGSAGREKGSAGRDKGSAGRDKGSAGRDKGSAGKEKRSAGKEKISVGRERFCWDRHKVIRGHQ